MAPAARSGAAGGGALLVAAVLFAALALVSAGDRMSARDPRFTSLIPDSLAVNAFRMQARIALANGDHAAAERLAEKALRRDPMQAQAAALVGATRLELNEIEGAIAAYRLAANLGWREPTTQLFWWSSAMQTGDLAIAAQRVDALLRQRPDFPTRDTLLQPLEATAAGRGELARVLAGSPAWLIPYTRDVYYAPAPLIANRIHVMRQVAAIGLRIGCEHIAHLVNAGVRRGLASEAHKLWADHCAKVDPKALLHDGDFNVTRVEGTRAAFEWQFPGDGSVDVSLAPKESGQALAIRSTSPLKRDVVNQALAAPAGSYRLSWQVVGDPPAAARRLAASLECAGRKSELAARPQGNRLVADFVLPPGCGTATIAFTIAPGAGSVLLDQVRLDRR